MDTFPSIRRFLLAAPALAALGLLGLSLCASLGAGCSSGVSTEQATEECQDLERRFSQCFGAPGVMEECIACREACGRRCSMTDEPPICRFSCD